MNYSKVSPFIAKFLIVFELLIGLSAVTGGYGLISTNGLGMPLFWLSDTPFDSYVVPGVILMCIVGGTYILAAVLIMIKHKLSFEMSAIAGFGLLIWIFTEMYMIKVMSWLQILYFAFGIITLVLTFILLRAHTKKNYKR